jgi:arylsulfatase A-like enzyme
MNILYFNPDELRADVLGCYGHPLVQTPNFDRLAAMGTRFNQCHVQHPVCSPSRCSFMTGWYPHTHGHRSLWHLLQPHEPNTLRYLKDAGYDVHWIGKNDLLATEALGESTTAIHDWHGWGGARNPFTRDDPRYYSFLYTPMIEPGQDEFIIEKAVRFLQARRPGEPPFMLYLPLIQPHCPYTCPEPYYSMYHPDDLPPLRPADLPAMPDFQTLIRRYRRLDECDEAFLRKVMAVYLGMVSFTDALLGRLLDTLEATGLMDTTAVFAFSDHGDWAGDYGLVEKWPSALDDCLTRIPMIARIPGGAAGQVVDELVECFDIMPTTLELAGVEPQHQHFAHTMMPQLHGAPGDPTRAAFAEGGYDPHEPHCFEGKPSDGVAGDPNGIYYPKGIQQQDHPESVSRATMIRTQTHKLIRRPGGQSELYDLVADPRETCNRIADPGYATIRGELEGRLLDWYIHTAGVTPLTPDPRGFPKEILLPDTAMMG